MCKIKEILVEQKKHIRFGEWSANDVSNFFSTFLKNIFCCHFQEAMERIKELLVEEKKHIRFGDWKDKEVIAEIVFPLIMNALVGLYVDIHQGI